MAPGPAQADAAGGLAASPAAWIDVLMESVARADAAPAAGVAGLGTAAGAAAAGGFGTLAGMASSGSLVPTYPACSGSSGAVSPTDASAVP